MDLPSFVTMFFQNGGGSTIAYVSLITAWWITWQDSKRKDSVIEEKDKQLLELTKETVKVAANADSTASSLLQILSSHSARR